VYAAAAIRAAYDEYAKALAGRSSLICYSVKANSNLALLAPGSDSNPNQLPATEPKIVPEFFYQESVPPPEVLRPPEASPIFSPPPPAAAPPSNQPLLPPGQPPA
jgi:hypothetical protein